MVKFLRLISIFLLTSSLNAGVKARVDYADVEVGEMVTYSLDLTGEDIERPIIQRLCDTDVISTSSNTSMQIINGSITRSYVLSYKFIPQKSCKIEPIGVVINGKTQLSNSVELKVKPVSGAADKEYELSLSTDKKNVLIGESFNVLLTFKQKQGARGVDSKFIAPEFKGFWLKKESRPIQYKKGLYNVTKVNYTLAAQRVGTLHVSKAQMRIATRSNRRDSFGSFMQNIRWKTYFSNELNIEVKALPEGIHLVGDFKISLKIDKTEVEANEAVNIEVKVIGDGNLEDMQSFKPYINGVSIFDEKVVVQGFKLSQKIAFVSDSDFTIPSFSIKYFDTKTKEVKTIQTKEVLVKVKGSKLKKEELIIKKDPDSVVKPKQEALHVERDKLTLIFVFVAGMLFGILLVTRDKFSFSKKEKAVSLKDPKNLLMKLLPFRDDDEVQKVIDKLEDNIYASTPLDIDKKLLKAIFKKYDI